MFVGAIVVQDSVDVQHGVSRTFDLVQQTQNNSGKPRGVWSGNIGAATPPPSPIDIHDVIRPVPAFLQHGNLGAIDVDGHCPE